MTWVIALVVMATLGIAAAAAAGGMGEMAKEPVRDTYRQPLPTRPLAPADLETFRFGITLRGYAMGQVDDLLDRMGDELAQRDAVIRSLTGEDPVTVLERAREYGAVGVRRPPEHAPVGEQPFEVGEPVPEPLPWTARDSE